MHSADCAETISMSMSQGPRVARQEGVSRAPPGPLADTAATQSAVLFPVRLSPRSLQALETREPAKAVSGTLLWLNNTARFTSAGPRSPTPIQHIRRGDRGVSRSTHVAGRPPVCQARDHHPGRLGTWTVENLSRLACLEVSHVPCMSLQRRWPPRQWGRQPGRPRLACPARLVARQLPSLQPPFSRVLRSTWRRRTAAMPHPGPMRPPLPPPSSAPLSWPRGWCRRRWGPIVGSHIRVRPSAHPSSVVSWTGTNERRPRPPCRPWCEHTQRGTS